MAGIYLHIPFCKQACHYCDFHFSTNLTQKSEMVKALVREIELQKLYLENEKIETIYFGGGTPSMLNSNELAAILDALHKNFTINTDVEITVEANPDDISQSKLFEFKNLNINRLSLGIQTFNDEKLIWMNRAHSSREAIEALNLCFEKGFDNLTIDLIYGLPSENHSLWENDLDIISKYPIPHISAYNLTIEPKTAFGKWQKTGKIKEASDEFSAQQMQILIERLTNLKFIHYEISNFAKEGHFSKHNTAYWQDKKYLGIGPSAHSYNIVSRQANIANNAHYIKSIQSNVVPFEIEILSEKDKANELILTGLRTIWGFELNKIHEFTALDKTNFSDKIEKFESQNLIEKTGGNICLTLKGKFYADNIASDLFFD